jgi:hypothetical protein
VGGQGVKGSLCQAAELRQGWVGMLHSTALAPARSYRFRAISRCPVREPGGKSNLSTYTPAFPVRPFAPIGEPMVPPVKNFDLKFGMDDSSVKNFDLAVKTAAPLFLTDSSVFGAFDLKILTFFLIVENFDLNIPAYTVLSWPFSLKTPRGFPNFGIFGQKILTMLNLSPNGGIFDKTSSILPCRLEYLPR